MSMYYIHTRPVGAGGTGVAMALPDFEDQLTLCKPRGAEYTHYNANALSPIFSGLPTALHTTNNLQLNSAVQWQGIGKICLAKDVLEININLQGRKLSPGFEWQHPVLKNLTTAKNLTLTDKDHRQFSSKIFRLCLHMKNELPRAATISTAVCWSHTKVNTIMD